MTAKNKSLRLSRDKGQRINKRMHLILSQLVDALKARDWGAFEKLELEGKVLLDDLDT